MKETAVVFLLLLVGTEAYSRLLGEDLPHIGNINSTVERKQSNGQSNAATGVMNNDDEFPIENGMLTTSRQFSGGNTHNGSDIRGLPIAFSATVPADTSIAHNGAVEFTQVVANEGGAYIPALGAFVCQNDHVYVLSVSIQSVGQKKAITRLVSDTDVLEKYGPVTRDKTSNAYPSGTSEMTTVIQCEANKIFRVRVTGWPDDRTNTELTGGITTFTGFRLSDRFGQTLRAFTAELGSTRKVVPGDTLKFDQPLSNIGGQFYPVHGVFLCTDNDFYVFSVTVEGTLINRVMVSLMIGGEEIITGPLSSSPRNDGGSGVSSLTTVAQCRTDTTVYVVAKATDDSETSEFEEILSTFTGYKIFTQGEENTVGHMFSAVSTGDQVDLEENMIVKYDQPLLNVGNGFNALTSTYICPVDGLYVFSVSLTSYQDARVKMVMDGETIKEGPHTDMHLNATYGSGMSSTTVVVHCTRDSQVSVQMTDTFYTGSYLIGRYNVFTGFRLHYN